MNYKYSVYFTALLMLVFLLFDLVSFTSPIDYCDYRVSNESLYYTVPENDTDIFKSGIPYLNKSYVGFKEAIAFKEHFACKSDIEKNLLARKNWSFANLILRD